MVLQMLGHISVVLHDVGRARGGAGANLTQQVPARQQREVRLGVAQRLLLLPLAGGQRQRPELTALQSQAAPSQSDIAQTIMGAYVIRKK